MMKYSLYCFQRSKKRRGRAVTECNIPYVGIYSTMYLHSYLGKQCICQYQTAKQITQQLTVAYSSQCARRVTSSMDKQTVLQSDQAKQSNQWDKQTGQHTTHIKIILVTLHNRGCDLQISCCCVFLSNYGQVW